MVHKNGVASCPGRCVLVGCLLMGASAANAAVERIFLKLDGIPGESANERHKNEIPVSSYGQSFINDPGSRGGPTTAKAACGDITVTKNLDKSSTALIDAVTTGKEIPNATISFGREGQQDYLTIGLTGVRVVGVDQAHQTDATRFEEKVHIRATRVQVTHRQQKPDGSMESPTTFSFDCAANKKI